MNIRCYFTTWLNRDQDSNESLDHTGCYYCILISYTFSPQIWRSADIRYTIYKMICRLYQAIAMDGKLWPFLLAHARSITSRPSYAIIPCPPALTDVLDADTITLILDSRTVCSVEVPPLRFQRLQETLVQQRQDAASTMRDAKQTLLQVHSWVQSTERIVMRTQAR